MRRSLLRSLILIVALFLSMSSKAHRGALEVNDSWMVYYECDKGPSFLFGQVIYDSWKEPTFYANGNRYRTLVVSDNSYVVDYYGNPDLYPKLYYRTEGDSIFRYDPSTDSDILMYSFGHEPGDIVTDGDGNRLMVREVFDASGLSGFSMFDGGEKAYRLVGVDDASLDDIWIENIGSANTGIFRRSDFDGMTLCRLSFLSGNDGGYSMAFPLDCGQFKSVPFEKDAKFYQFLSREEKRGLKAYIRYEFLDDTLHVRGMGTGMYPQNFDLMCTLLSDGVIDVRCQSLQCLGYAESDNMCNCKFNVRIPGFSPGTYTVRTGPFGDISAPDTLLDCLAGMPLSESFQRTSLSLFRKLSEESGPGTNLCFSPVSAQLALTMVENGAAGTTLREMQDALGTSGFTLEQVNGYSQSLMRSLTARPPFNPDKWTWSGEADETEALNRYNASYPVCEIANSLWFRPDVTLYPSFTDRITSYYDAAVGSVRFDTDDGVGEINRWVDDKTHGLIPGLYNEPQSGELAMVLADALYFKGAWSTPFLKESTQPGLFLPDDSRMVLTDMMCATGNYLVTYSDKFRTVTLPYGNGDFSMTLFVPVRGTSLPALDYGTGAVRCSPRADTPHAAFTCPGSESAVTTT